MCWIEPQFNLKFLTVQWQHWGNRVRLLKNAFRGGWSLAFWLRSEHLYLVLSSTLNSFVSMLREGITPRVTVGKCYYQMWDFVTCSCYRVFIFWYLFLIFLFCFWQGHMPVGKRFLSVIAASPNRTSVWSILSFSCLYLFPFCALLHLKWSENSQLPVAVNVSVNVFVCQYVLVLW